MSQGVKNVDVRLGNFACSIRGFDEPGPVLAAVLAAVRDMLEAGPVPDGAPGELTDSAAARLLEEAAAASGLPPEDLEVARGLLVTARPAAIPEAVGEAAPAVEAERAAPRLDAEASAEIKRVLEQAASLPSAPADAAALAARSHFGKRERQLDEPAPVEAVGAYDAPDDALPTEQPAPSDDMSSPMPEQEVAALAEEPAPATTMAEPVSELEPEPAPQPREEPEEEPLLLNIFDAPPPRSARPEPVTETVSDTVVRGPGLSEPSAEPWPNPTGPNAHADEAPQATAEEEAAEEPVAIGAARSLRHSGFFGRGPQNPSNDPAPVSLLRPLGKAASPRRVETPTPKPVPKAEAAGAPPSVQALAWRMGARTAEERVLCVAAWLTFAKGSPKFLRSAAFEELDAVETESERDLDSRLDAFRSLLRDGALVQLGTESYALSERQLDRAAPYFD
ncbi:MAG: hypothetical protein AAFP17_04700 [Pseudomonadota bacterium]